MPMAVEAPFKPRTIGSGIRKQEAQPLPEKWANEQRWETEARGQFSNWWVSPTTVARGDDPVERAASDDEEQEAPPSLTELDIALGNNAVVEDAPHGEEEVRRRRAFLQQKKAARVRQKRKKLLKKTDTKHFSKAPDTAMSEAFCKP